MDLFGLAWPVWAILSSLPILYWYLTRNFRYWKDRAIPGPKPVPHFGTSLFIMFKPMPLIEMNWFKQFGKIYGLYYKQNPVLTVAEPQLIKTILVKDFHLFTDRKDRPVSHEIAGKHLFSSSGDAWKRLRSIMSPTFTSGKMKKMYPMIKQCLNEFLDHLEVSAQNRDNIDLKIVYGIYTMDVIATCAFATKTNAYKDPNNPFIVNLKKLLEFPFCRTLMILAFPKLILKILNINSRGSDSATQFFLDLVRHILRERKANPKNNQEFDDFIQLLANAEKDKDDLHDKNDKNEAHHLNEGNDELEIERKTLNIKLSDKKLTEEEIMAQGYVFFIAGYETTATTLSFCSYELALNQEIQERLYEEVHTVFDDNGDINYETLSTLPFLDSVLSETLRMYPPVIRLERKASSDYKLGDTGIQLFKGQVVEIPVYAIHHSEEFYTNPDKFIPDRFMPENRSNIKPYTYLPFGAGPRNCIGMRFALMEAKLGLAQIIRKFRFFRSEQTTVPLEFKTVTPICSAKNIVVGIETRQ